MEDREFDVVVVGSGAGGGTVAKELAPLSREGVRIAVLEWGPRLRDVDYTGRELEMAERLYRDGGGFFTRDRTVTLAMGRAYGGSTVVYTGTSLPIQGRTVARWAVPGLDHRDLGERSEKYLRENGAHLLEEGELNENNRLFREGCRSLGYHAAQFPVNVRGCRGTSLCNLGCPNGAKQGTHRVQLPEAERQGVAVVTGCRVERIEEGACHVTVENPGFGLPSPWPPGRYRVRTRLIVVAAGAIESPALLARSRLPVRLPALGRYLTLHPALILVAQHDRPVVGSRGHPKSFICDAFAESHRFLLETCMYFPFVTARNLIGFGADHAAMMGAMDRLQMILALALDPALPENRVTVDRHGEPVVRYRLGDEVLDSLHQAMLASARIFFAAGARRVHAPAGARFFLVPADAARLEEAIPRRRVRPGRISITAAHLMGGCRMGEDPSDSVTDAWGQVHGLDWLYVADASLFPRAAEVNPYITVMALADRVAQQVRERLARA